MTEQAGTLGVDEMYGSLVTAVHQIARQAVA